MGKRLETALMNVDPTTNRQWRSETALAVVAMTAIAGVFAIGTPGEVTPTDEAAAKLATAVTQLYDSSSPVEQFRFAYLHPGMVTTPVSRPGTNYGLLGLTGDYSVKFGSDCLDGSLYDTVLFGKSLAERTRQTGGSMIVKANRSDVAPLHFLIENGRIVPAEDSRFSLASHGCPTDGTITMHS